MFEELGARIYIRNAHEIFFAHATNSFVKRLPIGNSVISTCASTDEDA